MIAAMIISTGCGSNTTDDAKKDTQPVAQKVEQGVDNAKKADQPASNGQPAAVDGKFSIGGIAPGMSLDEVKQVLGEPTSSHEGEEFTFANGLMIDLNDFGKVEEIKTLQAGVKTAAGIEVGMTEQNLNASYGAPAQIENDDGLVEHKYYSNDGRIKMKFKIGNGTIVEIKCSDRD